MPGSKPSDIHSFLAGHGIARPTGLLGAAQPAPAEGLSPPIFVDACSGVASVSASVPPLSPAEQLARTIKAAVSTDQASRHNGGHNPREVMDALAIATSDLLAAYAQSFPAGTDFVQAFIDKLQEQASGATGAGTPIPRGKTH